MGGLHLLPDSQVEVCFPPHGSNTISYNQLNNAADTCRSWGFDGLLEIRTANDYAAFQQMHLGKIWKFCCFQIVQMFVNISYSTSFPIIIILSWYVSDCNSLLLWNFLSFMNLTYDLDICEIPGDPGKYNYDCIWNGGRRYLGGTVKYRLGALFATSYFIMNS